MLKRLGLIGIGCLVAMPVMNGCSSSNSTDAGTDAGPVDAGEDAGTTSGQLGDPCTAPTRTAENCAGDLICLAVGSGNMCSTEGCEEAYDAGTPSTNPCGVGPGNIAGVCVPLALGKPADSVCAAGCDEDGGCSRDGFSCWTTPDVSGVGCSGNESCPSGERCVDGVCSYAFCWPDCNTPAGACPYGSTCNSKGQCESTLCLSSGSCGTNEICYENSAQNEGECVADCRTSGEPCPTGWSCEMDAGICQPPIAHFGELCGSSSGASQCDSTTECVQFATSAEPDPPSGECLTPCVSDSQCPTGSTCSITLSTEMNVCTPPGCGADAASTTCANQGMSCEMVQVSQTMLESVCIPK